MSDFLSSLNAVGAKVDAALARQGFTLTVGGEPTLVAHDYRDTEWNFSAMGPTKLTFARRFAQAWMKTVPAGALVTHTMGKQYPGEPIPRWVVSVHWRKDGKPLFPTKLLRFDTSAPQNLKQAKAFSQAIAKKLGFASKLRPAFDQNEAHTLAGYVLPIDGGAGAWTSPDWPLKDPEEIFLWPGESPIGLRLPLHRLDPEAPRRALCVDVRNHELSVFIPPVVTLEDYLDLLRVVREALEATGVGPVVLEGYDPPSGGKLTRIGFAADPGVLEINLPPASSFAQCTDFVNNVYACGKKAGLQPFKYQYTGRQVGSGGGAHILLGGASVDENPFFLQPTLLSSFIRFLQHHPSLSFLFTGLFVGPSSQAPRVDESDHDIVYELEIALRSIEKMEAPANRPLLDLMLRHLLMDTVGNTHRAEISIDKFWNPLAPNGSLGLVEFRAFEMPPRPEMWLAAVGLIRALAAAFLKKPYHGPLKRWGLELHDRFSLPHFIHQDFETVLAYLAQAGFEFEFAAFEPWFAFRFPVVGTLSTPLGSVEFRQAIEPWPVLSEQVDGATTSRSVDASMDRLQVTLPTADFTKKYQVLALGTPLAFHSDQGKSFGAIRYRMYYNVPGLQPQVPVQSPLVLEVVDRATGKVVAAKALHNWSPFKVQYNGLPKSEAQATARVAERFVDLPDNVGQLRHIQKLPALFESRYTTDLRFFP